MNRLAGDGERAGIALELQGAHKRWRGGAALAGVDLQVPRGAIVGLVGPSGAGKTTAIRVGLGLLAPDAGSARVFGEPSSRVARHSSRIGLLLDGPALEPGLTVEENLALHARRHGRALPDTRPLIDALALTTLVRRRAKRLSQGEQYRVALARALVFEPDLLVLDEPVAHLDPELAHVALELVHAAALSRGAAALVSSHQLAELERIATHLVLLHRGKVLLAGDLPTLFAGIAPALVIAARPLEAAKAAVERHPAVARVEVVRFEGSEMLRAELRPRVEFAGEQAAASINQSLHAAGLEVSRLAPERPTIAELFRRTLAGAAAGAKTGATAVPGRAP